MVTKEAQYSFGIRKPRFNTVFDSINYFLVTLVMIVVLYPLVFIISASFSDPYAVLDGRMLLWPVGFTLEGYQKIFQSPDIWRGFANSVVYTVVGTAINIALTIMAAYPLSRKDLVGRNIFTLIFAFTMFFSGGLIPVYLVVKGLGMMNTMWALIIPSAVSMWNIIVMRTYFQTAIPGELFEAAQIDGCSNMKYLIRILLPLSKPIIAVMVLFYGAGQWNKFFEALIYLRKSSLYPLQLILRDILIRNILTETMRDPFSGLGDYTKTSEIIKYGLIVVSSIPMLILYPFIQKYFVKGVMIGSIKG